MYKTNFVVDIDDIDNKMTISTSIPNFEKCLTNNDFDIDEIVHNLSISTYTDEVGKSILLSISTYRTQNDDIDTNKF